MHLKPEEFIDLADGTRAASAFPHLDVCDACRGQLAELRTTMMSLVESDGAAVPEPPPFFWSQLQNRVSSAVAAVDAGEDEASSGIASRLRWLLNPRVLVPLTAIAILALAIPIGGRKSAPAVAVAPGLSPTAINNASADDPLEDTFDDDASLQLVADLAGSIDLSAASEAGLTPHGSADHAVTHLDAQELQELRRLLKAELGT
jgi:hypothetical protein